MWKWFFYLLLLFLFVEHRIVSVFPFLNFFLSMPRTHYYSLEGFWNFDILLLFSFFFPLHARHYVCFFLFSVLLLVAFQCFFNNSFFLLSLTFFHLSLSWCFQSILSTLYCLFIMSWMFYSIYFSLFQFPSIPFHYPLTQFLRLNPSSSSPLLAPSFTFIH